MVSVSLRPRMDEYPADWPEPEPDAAPEGVDEGAVPPAAPAAMVGEAMFEEDVPW